MFQTSLRMRKMEPTIQLSLLEISAWVSPILLLDLLLEAVMAKMLANHLNEEAQPTWLLAWLGIVLWVTPREAQLLIQPLNQTHVRLSCFKMRKLWACFEYCHPSSVVVRCIGFHMIAGSSSIRILMHWKFIQGVLVLKVPLKEKVLAASKHKVGSS